MILNKVKNHRWGSIGISTYNTKDIAHNMKQFTLQTTIQSPWLSKL